MFNTHDKKYKATSHNSRILNYVYLFRRNVLGILSLDTVYSAYVDQPRLKLTANKQSSK